MTMDFTPRLMPAPAAAHYIGVSETKLRELKLPKKELGGKRVYDRVDLDAFANNLPYEGARPEADECDKLFGVAS